jgi:hypothetical protein
MFIPTVVHILLHIIFVELNSFTCRAFVRYLDWIVGFNILYAVLGTTGNATQSLIYTLQGSPFHTQ